jgi:hypothetical protein
MAEDESDIEADALLAGAKRAQAMQRLQLGMFGLGAMVLLIGLANIIMNQAMEAEASMVPEAAPTVAPASTPTPASDPLADAGVGPDLPAEPLKPTTQQLLPSGPTDAPPANTN